MIGYLKKRKIVCFIRTFYKTKCNWKIHFSSIVRATPCVNNKIKNGFFKGLSDLKKINDFW